LKIIQEFEVLYNVNPGLRHATLFFAVSIGRFDPTQIRWMLNCATTWNTYSSRNSIQESKQIPVPSSSVALGELGSQNQPNPAHSLAFTAVRSYRTWNSKACLLCPQNWHPCWTSHSAWEWVDSKGEEDLKMHSHLV